jgi:hypothetical protein
MLCICGKETTMGTVRAGDDGLHYSDNSHRWIAPPDIEQDAWETKLRAHLDQHLITMGGPAGLCFQREFWSPHAPHRRMAKRNAARRTGTRAGRG